MNKNNYVNYLKDDDYPRDCDECGMTAWFSAMTILDKDTSKGGLVVCPNCVFTTDWGALPYTIGPEESVKNSSNYQQSVTGGGEINLNTYDPLSGDNL